MKMLTAGTIARVYLVVALVLSTLFASVFQLGIALVLLGIEGYSMYKPLKAGLNLGLVVASLVVAPLAFEALVGMYAVLLIFPALFLLDESLRNYALTQRLSFKKTGRGASDVLRLLTVALTIVFCIAFLTWNFTFLVVAILLLGYLGSMVLHAFCSIPKLSLQEAKSWSRVVVGNAENEAFSLKNKADSSMLVSLRSANDWVNLAPTDFQLIGKGEVKVSLKYSAPLAGPSKIQVQASYVDSRGLIQVGQVLEPLNLHIIPRAKYAAWLANKFLEKNSGGNTANLPSVSSGLVKQGIEFFGSRSYQTGDQIKNIDWKHSYMLGELIVKEFSSSQSELGVILVNLSAESLEDADVLAYDLVMSALTFATEGLPSGLAAYNQDGVVSVVQPMGSRETLKEALALTAKINVVEVKSRVLEAAVGGRLKRSMDQLSEVNGESAQRLEKLLVFESHVNEEAVKAHPAALALDRVVGKINGSAVITVVSSVDEDAGVLSLILESLGRKGFASVYVREQRVVKSLVV